MNTKMNITIVDAGANLVTFAHMDGSWLDSLGISIIFAFLTWQSQYHSSSASPLRGAGDF